MGNKAHDNALLFLQKANTATVERQAEFKESFEQVNPVQANGFKGMFGEYHLEQKEQTQLQMILFDHYTPGGIKEEQVTKDLQELISLTSELRAINKQSLILQGQRIKKAQILLRNYKDGAFTSWLLTTYGNRQTPYSILQYYELHQSLPPLARMAMEKLPRKAAYALASRQGALERKRQIIEEYSGESQNDLIALIIESFPSFKPDKRRKTINQATIDAVDKLVTRLKRRKNDLTDSERKKIQQIALLLSGLA